MMQRIIALTGAASGIGAATAERLAAPGVGLVLHTRSNEAGLDAVANSARERGAEAVCVLGDLAVAATAEAIVGAAENEFGGLCCLIANAGFADARGLEALDDDGLAQSFQIIEAAFLRLVRRARAPLAAARHARIVAVSSFVAHTFRLDGRHMPASAAAKAGLEALVRAFAVELAPERITVNAVVPGFVEKDPGAHRAISSASFAGAMARIPLARLGRPDDIAAAIAYLVGPEADYVTGQRLHVDGGLTL